MAFRKVRWKCNKLHLSFMLRKCAGEDWNKLIKEQFHDAVSLVVDSKIYYEIISLFCDMKRAITFSLSVSVDIIYYTQYGGLVVFCCAGWPTGLIHRWHQLHVSWYITSSSLWLRCFPPSWLTWLHAFLWLTGMCLPPLILLLNPLHPISTLVPCSLNLSHSLYPCLCPCSHDWAPTLAAALGPEEEVQSSAILRGGGLWGGLSWAASGPGPERSQHAQRTGACMHLSTQGFRWEPSGCT